MNKKQVQRLLEILHNNHCLNPEWSWCDEDKNGRFHINEDSLWVMNIINDISSGKIIVSTHDKLNNT